MNDIFYSGQALIKDKGVMADLSKKIELFINELPEESVVPLSRLVKNREVGVIIMSPDRFEVVFDMIKEAQKLLPGNSEEPESNETITADDIPSMEDRKGYGFH